VYEFKLREGLKFHNGDPFTADDVKFSFLRYRGASAKLLHDRVKSVDILDPYRVRFVLHTPWPDFLVFYATPATGAAWVVPKKYIEKVGEDGSGVSRWGSGLSLRAHESRHRAGARAERAVLAQEALDQARGHQGRPRPYDTHGHA